MKEKKPAKASQIDALILLLKRECFTQDLARGVQRVEVSLVNLNLREFAKCSDRQNVLDRHGRSPTVVSCLDVVI